MGKGFLIDSNTVLYYAGGKLPSASLKKVHDIIDEQSNVSVITKIEVLGYNLPVKEANLLVNFFIDSNVLELTENIVDKTIEIRKSTKIKIPDAIIAATALVHDFTLVTRNIADFKKIIGLELLNPWDL